MSMKRSTSPVDLGDDGNARKRSKTAQSPIVEVDLAEDFAESPQITYTGEDIDIFNKDPEQLLGRSAALVLEHIGYHGASQEAIEGLCSEAAVCELRFHEIFHFQ
jgi:transcription initiation factor TFIID subunit 8